MQNKKIEKGPNIVELGLIVTTGEIQAQSQTNHTNAVARGTHLGCGRTLVRAHPGAGAPLEAANWAHLSQAVACRHA